MKKFKRSLKELPKKTMALLMAFSMLANFILPITTVFAAAPADTSTYGVIQINGNTTLENKDNSNEVIATYERGSLRISGAGLYSDGNNTVYGAGNVTIDCTADANYTCELWQNGTNSNGSTISLNNIVPNQVINIDATFNATQNQNPGNDPQQNTNTEAAMTVSAGAGSYQIRGNNVNYDDEVEISINGFRWDHSNTIQYNADNSDTTVTFTFETLWINRFYDNITINGVSYNVSDYLDFDDRTEWLIANHGTQALAFDIPNVAKADSYNVVVKHGENNGSKYLATFLWTADPAQAGGHDYIGHSTLEFVKAVYTVGSTEYTVTEEDLEGKLQREGDFMSASSDDGFLSYGVVADVDYDDGSLTLPGNAQITMRVVPDYGYQVTSVNGGSNFTTTNSGVSEFTITVADGTAGYFQAEVTRVDDEVLANSDKVSSGTIEIANNEINSGTVQLSVDDVELTSDKIKDFNEAAGSNLKINSYLDINLNKVLYKGTADDVWSEQIHHLNNKALITLQLEEGVDVSDLVIVHNIDDGDEFEIIEIESYDAETNTITFYTDSFSNYAIATKTSTSNTDNANTNTNTNTSTTTSNPQTGDNIYYSIIMLILSFAGLSYSGLVLYKRKKYVFSK